MAETTNNSASTNKSASNYHPYYFTLFQNYCCGPKSRAPSASSNKDLFPIPESFKTETAKIVKIFNEKIFSQILSIRDCNISIPSEFFNQQTQTESFRYLIDRLMWKAMADTRVINWFPNSGKMYPIRTSGNGNCLLHAVLISMTGIHDFDLIFRNHLIQFMQQNEQILKKFWKGERIRTDKQYGIQTEEKTLETEWQEVCDQVHHENGEDGEVATSLQYLEAIHVFCVSNMIHRPIIVLSEEYVRNKHGEAISVNDLFGIYLPILSGPEQCYQSPIVLVYDQSHFCPLLSEHINKNSTKNVDYLPLYQSEERALKKRMLSVKFIDPDMDEQRTMEILKQYLSVGTLPYQPDSESKSISIYCAELQKKTIPQSFNIFWLYWEYCMDFYKIQYKLVQQEKEDEENRRRQINLPNNQEKVRQVVTNFDQSLSSPPSYASVIATAEPERRPNTIYERRMSYENAVKNGTVDVLKNPKEKDLNIISTQQANSSVQVVNQTPTNPKPIENKPNTDNIHNSSRSNDLMIDERTNSKHDTPTRSSNSKFKQDVLKTNQQQQQQEIYIQNPNRSDWEGNDLIDFDKRIGPYKFCTICKSPFEDLGSQHLCPDCNSKKYYANSPQNFGRHVPVMVISSRTDERSRLPSDFISPKPPSRPPPNRLQPSQSCPNCRNINRIMHKSVPRNSFYCSVCGVLLH